MRVWRVAHDSISEDGFPTGPYRQRRELSEDDRDALREMSWAHGDDRHPSPNWDPSLVQIRYDERCGFNSLSALYGWFEEQWREALRAAGYYIYVYVVPGDDARVGEYGQTLFLPVRALLVDLLEIEIGATV